MNYKSINTFVLVAASVLTNEVFAIDTDFKLEAKANLRYSEDARFETNFPTGSAHETVDEGTHFEISNIALLFNTKFGENWSLNAKVDIFDLYERNPTSGDLEVSLDRLTLRYGDSSLFPNVDGLADIYGQIGKFGKLERQEDRHLESYGLVSTAFNRVEDSGIEIGLNTRAGLYTAVTYTSGNPVFFRDANALAGDNGIRGEAEYEPGVLVLYDAEVEEFDLSDTPEIGVSLGYRWNNESTTRINAMIFGYERDLAESKELHGTFYGGDLDFFEFSELFIPNGPIDPANDDASVPLEDNKKSEAGMNLWLYHKNFTMFAQYVDQTIGGLERDGAEIEISYNFNTSNLARIKSFQPVLRYSALNNDFTTPVNYPSPSIAWDWRKLDIGFNVIFTKTFFLTAEYAINKFEVRGETEQNNEALFTLTWRYD